jgi:two-component system sensor histidine kinase RegB
MPQPRPASPDTVRVAATLRRLVLARWWVVGVAAFLSLLAPAALDIPLSVWPLLAVAAVVAVWNGISHRRLYGVDDTVAAPASDGSAEIFSQLCFDLVALSALLFFSGGATNPLVFMLLPPVAIAALTLPQRLVAGIAAIAIAAYSILMVSFIPLPLADPARAAALHLSGMWVTFVVSVAIISWFILRMTEALRQRDAELAAAREQTLRDERVLALGTLAASAAHELGTPLATMAVLADELEHDARLGAEAHADLQLMREQIGYCKRIITGLTERAGAGRSEHVERVASDAWLQRVFDDWSDLRGHPPAAWKKVGSGETAPTMVAEPTLEHGLFNLLDNALRAGAPVKVVLDWDTVWLTITVCDHGPGFSVADLHRAGQEAFPAHARGSGVGLLLTRAAIERQGGQLSLSNAPEGGAIAQLRLPLESMATMRAHV